MKNNILYIIGVAFALVLMVFFSGFFRNVDFFSSKSIASNYKDAYIQGLNDPVSFDLIKDNFKNLYSKSSFVPNDEMLSNSANCFKKQIFDNVINVENKEKQEFLATKTKIYNEDDYSKVIEIITNKFKQDIQTAINHCKNKHIEKEEVIQLQCDTTEIYELFRNGLTLEEWDEKGISTISYNDKRIIFVSFTSNKANNNLNISNMNGNSNNEITFFENDDCSKWNLKGISCLKKIDKYDGSINLNRLDGSISYFGSISLDQNDNLGVTSIDGTCKKIDGNKNKF